MWIKLLIQSRFGGPGSQTTERSFDQDTILLGRAATNDLTLSDPQRVISSRHAEIRRAADGFSLVDIGSTNGTLLNGKRVQPSTVHRLNEGDQIRIGEYVIQCCPVAAPSRTAPAKAEAPSTPPQAATPAPEPSAAPPWTRRAHETFIWKLRRCYAGLSRQPSAQRRQSLESILRDAVRGLERAQAFELLEEVERRFVHARGAPERPPASSGPQAPRATPAQGDARQAAYDGVARIARTYLTDVEEGLTPALVEDLVCRLERVFEIVVHHLAAAVRGRREFEREFEVEATRILSWNPNPIKLAEDGREVGQYLLDARPREASLEKVAADLEGVFRDLTLHQLGMVAGFRECLRGLLQQLTPESFEQEAKKTRVKLGPIALMSPFETRLQLLAWQRFKQKHQRLTEEEVKVFESILAPHFAKGYLAIQKTRTGR